MIRDITKEEQEALKNAAYMEGYARALEISKAEIETREKQSLERGIRTGRNQVFKRWKACSGRSCSGWSPPAASSGAE